MKLGLCVFFNYPFPRNIPIWRELYGDIFEEIVFIQPLTRSEDPDVVTVYRAAFNFAGFFSDARSALESMDVDAIVFTGDDCILNPGLFGPDFADRFRWTDEVSCFIPELLEFASPNWWRSSHRIATMARFIGSYGLYDQRIESWERFLPDRVKLEEKIRAAGLPCNKLPKPPPEAMEKFTRSQVEVINRVFKGQQEVEMPYPVVYAISDFFIVAKRMVPEFCHQAGMLASLNVFPESAVPTALVGLEGVLRQAKDCGLSFQWTYGRNQDAQFFVPTSVGELRDCIAGLSDKSIFVHPVKLSSIVPTLPAPESQPPPNPHEDHRNTSFSRQLAADKSAAMMREIALVTSRTGFSISRSDLEEIEHAKEEISRNVDCYFGMIGEVASERRANLERYRDIQIVSLGEDCFSRTLATHWGLKKCAKLGELSHPFDLAVHPLPKLAKLIDSGFEDYMQPENLTYKEDQDFCRNELFNINFNHEHGRKYAENDFSLLREIYQKRIANFAKCLTEGKRLVFILHLIWPRPRGWIHLNRLANVLERKCGTSDFLLICINTTGASDLTGVSAEIPANRHRSIVVVDAPYPSTGYVWYAPKDCLNPAGHQFEKKLVESLKAIIDRKWEVSSA